MKKRIREEDFCYIILFKTGQVGIFKKEVVEFLESDDYNRYKPFEIKKLDHKLEKKRVLLKAPIMVGLQLTNKCNLHCKHCYMQAGTQFKNELTLEEIKDLLDDLKKMKVMFLFLTGGEPTLRKDFTEIINYVSSLDFDFNILTNGLNLSEEILSQIPQNSTFVISFDGFNAHKIIRNVNSYSYLFQLFKILKKKQISFLTQYVLQKDNLNEIIDLYTWCEKHEIIITALDLWPVGRAMDHPEIFPTEDDLEVNKLIMEKKLNYEKKILKIFRKTFQSEEISNPNYINILKKFNRLMRKNYPGNTFAFITADGDVYPDNYHAGDKVMCAGNTRNHSFNHIWNNGFNEIRELTFDNFPCNDCIIMKKGFECDLQMPVYSYNLHKNFKSCGATVFLKKAILERNLMRLQEKNSLSKEDALLLDNF